MQSSFIPRDCIPLIMSTPHSGVFILILDWRFLLPTIQPKLLNESEWNMLTTYIYSLSIRERFIESFCSLEHVIFDDFVLIFVFQCHSHNHHLPPFFCIRTLKLHGNSPVLETGRCPIDGIAEKVCLQISIRPHWDTEEAICRNHYSWGREGSRQNGWLEAFLYHITKCLVSN